MKVHVWAALVVLVTATGCDTWSGGADIRPVPNTSVSVAPEVGTATYQSGVRLQAFCVPEVSWGMTNDGVKAYCLREGIDTQARWWQP